MNTNGSVGGTPLDGDSISGGLSFWPRTLLASVILLTGAFGACPVRADTLTKSGRGEAVIQPASKKAMADANRAALAKAEDAAVHDALSQTVFEVYGDRSKLGPEAERILADVTAHSASMIKDRDTRRAEIIDGRAIVEIVLRVDGKSLRDYLEHSLGLSLAQGAEGKFRVFVLTYTVEGQDASRTEPVVLKEEVSDNRKNVQADSHASSSSDKSANAKAVSLQASAASSDRTQASTKSEGSFEGSQKSSGSARASDSLSVGAIGSDGAFRGKADSSASADSKSSSAVKASGKESADINYSRKQEAALDARSASASSSSRQRSESGSTFSDTSTQYHRLVVYADPTKKGAGATNEVRAKLGELLKVSGFDMTFADVSLQGRDFANEDELYRAILTEMRVRPEVRREDYVAVALNRFTPLSGQPPRFTAQIVYRIVRLGDGKILLPDKVVAGDSGDQSSEDVARTVATELAMMKVHDVLPREVASALKELQRAAARESTVAATSYAIRIDRISSPTTTRSIKDALRGAGFTIASQFRGEAKSETITVTLNGKTGDDVVAVLESFLGGFDVLSLDARTAELKAR